jgi:uncharacterized membrane protein YtjA (UPF0391 family)
MLQLALTFLVLALVAGLLGFTPIAASFAGVAHVLFVVFLILFLISAVASALRGHPPV